MARVTDVDSKLPEPEAGIQAQIDSLKGLLADTNINVFRTLAVAPLAYRGFLDLSAHLFLADLDRVTREAVVLRVSAVAGSAYEWGGHVPSARAAGLDDDQIRAIRDGSLAGLTEPVAAAVRYGEAVERRTVDDAVWAAARAHFTESQMVELTVLAATYSLASRAMLALDVQLDSAFRGLDHP